MDAKIDAIGAMRRAAAKNPRPLVSFSLGVDSLAMYLRLKESGLWDMSQAVLYYMYFLPHLPLVDDYIDYFEAREGIKLVQVPGPFFLLRAANWQHMPPHRVEALVANQKTKYGIPEMKNDEIEYFVKKACGFSDDDYTCVGIKGGDSAMRRMALRKTNGINENKKKVYPIGDFENRDVYEIIKRHGLKVPVDYRLFGISFENIEYRFLKPISEQCPETYKKILEWFPLMPMSLSRYEYYHPDWAPFPGKKRKLFADMILEPRRAI